MLGSILATVGSNLGKYFGSGILSTIGRYAGKRLGDYLEKKWTKREIYQEKYLNIHDSFYLTKAEYGTAIPLIFGKMRLNGKIIWMCPIEQQNTSETSSKYFKKNNTTLKRTTITAHYYASFAVAICEGEIADIEKIWYEDQLIDLSSYKFRLYKGSQTQLPDPYILSHTKNAPAYRGLAYIIFERLPLAEFDDKIPNFSFEVRRPAQVHTNQKLLVEDMVTSMIMIPGSGEYVYDTVVQEKIVISSMGSEIRREKINSHNQYNIANSLRSLDQLQSVCKNIQWLAVVACWFGDDLDVNKCKIRPAIEFRDKSVKYSTDWQVEKYNRHNAYEISKDAFGNPLYGGSINDQSIVNYLIELKKRNISIMFYPMFFMDVPGKPWRGRMTGSIAGVKNFFNNPDGYKRFILHYARLVKDYVQAFVIGSEMIGITSITDGKGYFPAVDELIDLAKQVKSIVGDKVLVTYAADWSEYHHTTGGWYNLDPLWSSKYIDFVGIDAYFPIIQSTSSAIDFTDIKAGFKKGEGYDYYYDHERNSHQLSPEYAWKNLGYWWKNAHINPDGKVTAWKPKQKPIWFTEFGFPSIDKAPNQPNVFFDPKCIDGGVPRGSNGKIDLAIQRQSIKAFIEFWQEEEYVEQMFLWTWDARPYPAWPHLDIWKDNYLWSRGHWVNDKFGSSSVAAILLEISAKCNINLAQVKVDNIEQVVSGLAITSQSSAMTVINTLRSSYFFDLNSTLGNINFVPRQHGQQHEIQLSECIKNSSENYFTEIIVPQEAIVQAVDIFYVDALQHYQTAYHHQRAANHSSQPTAVMRLPISLSLNEVINIGQTFLDNAISEQKIFTFTIAGFLAVAPADFVTLKSNDYVYQLRVIEVEIENDLSKITAIIDDKINYQTKHVAEEIIPSPNYFAETELEFVTLLEDGQAKLNIYLTGTYAQTLYMRVGSTNQWQYVTKLAAGAVVGTLINSLPAATIPSYCIDYHHKIKVRFTQNLLNEEGQWQRLLVGQEIIAFRKVNLLDEQEHIYELSELIRNFKGSGPLDNTVASVKCLLLDKAANSLALTKFATNKLCQFKCNNQLITYEINNINKMEPYVHILKQTSTAEQLFISWVVCDQVLDYWQLAAPSYKYKITIEGQGLKEDYFSVKPQIIINLATKKLSAVPKIVIIPITAQKAVESSY